MKKDNLSLTLAAAALAIAVGATGGPALASAAHKAINADKVDGLRAVKSTTVLAKRKNVLVATDKHGLLPNNIIKRAPDSAELDGFTGAQSRTIPLLSGAASLNGDAVDSGGGGVVLPKSPSAGVAWSVVLPPDYKPGSRLTLDLNFVSNDGGCAADFTVTGAVAPVPVQSQTTPIVFPIDNGSPTGLVTFPPKGANTAVVVQKTLTGTSATNLKPGRFLIVTLVRSGTNVADTCAADVTSGPAILHY